MIRRAVVADIPKLQNLLSQILSVHHAVRPDIFKANGSKFSDQELEDIMSNDQRPIFIYEDDKGDFLGHLFLIIQETKGLATQPKKTLFIDDLCVDESARGQKIGEKLYQFAYQKAIEWECYNLTLNVWNANEGAVRFYEQMGMIPQSMRMETILNPEWKDIK
ncbi:GNAT family N-acetyltransferase [Streptococcus pluranimalium]|uniref:GNAT family N-acetyltransferase n=1 Tax=Streptococcus pluranimalium TaxID=82348 RepID=UPI002A7E72EC|nr:GNAT family N-acetyltransferase [Streptococcus pluranimalium]HEM6115762.1 GNAT family N-acetyltransferase [Streptococcus suis]